MLTSLKRALATLSVVTPRLIVTDAHDDYQTRDENDHTKMRYFR